jgi:DNA anti-recombination protein RmuC
MMKAIYILLIIAVAALIAVSAVLIFYNVRLDRSVKDVTADKSKELDKMMAEEREIIKENLNAKYKEQMDAFAELAKSVEDIKKKAKEVENTIKSNVIKEKVPRTK